MFFLHYKLQWSRIFLENLKVLKLIKTFKACCLHLQKKTNIFTFKNIFNNILLFLVLEGLHHEALEDNCLRMNVNATSHRQHRFRAPGRLHRIVQQPPECSSSEDSICSLSSFFFYTVTNSIEVHPHSVNWTHTLRSLQITPVHTRVQKIHTNYLRRITY